MLLIIETCDGEVVNVQNLPDGWDYEVHDYAKEPDDCVCATTPNSNADCPIHGTLD